MDELLGEVRVAGAGVQPTVVQQRHPADALVELSSDADLLVMGSRGRWLRRAGARFGDDALVLRATCPGGRGSLPALNAVSQKPK
ncbi:MAG TPA: hypothetical protein VF933_23155 [Streptosporangiaceae bacterium]